MVTKALMNEACVRIMHLSGELHSLSKENVTPPLPRPHPALKTVYNFVMTMLPCSVGDQSMNYLLQRLKEAINGRVKHFFQVQVLQSCFIVYDEFKGREIPLALSSRSDV